MTRERAGWSSGRSIRRSIASMNIPRYGYVVVPLFAVLALLLFPLLYNLWISFHVQRLSPSDGQFAGIQNYVRVARYDHLLATVRRTLVWTVGSVVFQGVIGIVAAILLDSGLALSGVMRALLLTPWVVPGVVAASVWLFIFNPISGLLPLAASWFGVSGLDLLGHDSTALGAVITANVWKGVPFWLLMISASLKSIPQERYEAAALDGASFVQRVVHIVIPGISGVLLLASVLAFVWTFNSFEYVYLMTTGGPNSATTTMPFLIWQTSFSYTRFDEGAVQSVLTFIMMGVCIVGYLVVMGRRKQT